MKYKKFLAAFGFAAAMTFGLASCGQKQQAGNAEDAATEEAVTETAPAAADGVIVLGKGENIAPANGKLIVIDFNATWCGPCKQFAPHFDAVAKANTANATFYSVDVDVHPELAGQYDVQSIPMVVYIKPDGTVDSTVGYMDEAQFAEAVAAHLN